MPLVLDGADALHLLEAVRILRAGGVVVLPTDTLYGLSASVFRPDAVERIFEIKRRPAEMRVPLLLSSAADLAFIASDIPRSAWLLIDRFWPGALTLVLRAGPAVPINVTRGGGTIAVRTPAARSCLQVLQSLGEPVTGTSANVSGQPSLTRAAEVLTALPEVDAILSDDAAISTGVASTVVDLSSEIPTITRVGALSIDEIRETIRGRVNVVQVLTNP